MSIDRNFDNYLERQGITPTAEVVPDHPCQVFDGPLPVPELASARDLVERLLSRSGGLNSVDARVTDSRA